MTLEKEKLIEYLRHGIEISTASYVQQMIADDYYAEMENIKPVYVEKPMPESPELEDEGDNGKLIIILGTLMLSVFMFIDYKNELYVNTVYNIVRGLFYGGCGGYLLWKGIDTNKWNRILHSRNEAFVSEYHHSREMVIQENTETKLTYERDHALWQESLEKSRQFFDRRLTESQETIEKFFSDDVIYTKYRNLPALTSMYEYLTSGRCDELTGPNGAYNIYEKETRQDTIITKLDVIIRNLEQIKKNQYVLYQELIKIQNNLTIISMDIHSIKEYTHDIAKISSVNLYYNSITAANTSALAFLEAIR